MCRGGAEREGDTESRTGSEMSLPHTGLEPTNREIMTRAAVQSGHFTYSFPPGDPSPQETTWDSGQKSF